MANLSIDRSKCVVKETFLSSRQPLLEIILNIKPFDQNYVSQRSNIVGISLAVSNLVQHTYSASIPRASPTPLNPCVS
jgi:hypothetical protein